MIELKHMDAASRNQRLRETLEGMGLFVVPIFCESDPTRIDYMQVSVTLPSYVVEDAGQQTAGPRVSTPVTCSKVAESVESVESKGDNVIDLPSILGSKAVV